MDSRPETIGCVNGEKVFGRFLHNFTLKAMERIGMKGTYLNKIKNIYDRPIVTIPL